MISMLCLEMKLLRKRKMQFIVMVSLPTYVAVIGLVVPDAELFLLQLIPLLIGWLLIGDRIISMKRYRQFESLFSLGVAVKNIFAGNLLSLGIYYVYIFLIFLPLYLPGISIGSMIELRALFFLACLLMAVKGLANYAALLIGRVHLIGWATMLIFMLAIFDGRHIQAIAEHPYSWMVLPISLIAIAISYLMAARLSRERIILSSE